MKKLIFIICLLVPFLIHAQSDGFLSGIDEFLTYFVSDGYTIVDHGGNNTNTNQVIYPKTSKFDASVKYSLIVLVDDCYSCPLSVRFIYKDGSSAKIKMKIKRNNGLTVAQYHFREKTPIEGEFEIQVDSKNDYYTYMVLVSKNE